MTHHPLHRRRRRVSGRRGDALQLARNLMHDARYRKLPPTAREVGLALVVIWGDAEGACWPSADLISRTLGHPVSSIWAAIRTLVGDDPKRPLESGQAPLFTRTPYYQPSGRQGSTEFRLDPKLAQSLEDASSTTADGEGKSSPSETRPPGSLGDLASPESNIGFARSPENSGTRQCGVLGGVEGVRRIRPQNRERWDHHLPHGGRPVGW